LLYLVVEVGLEAAAAEQLLAATSPAALLITPAAEKPLTAQGARPLVDIAQGRGIAVLIEGDAALARALRADGVHVPWSKDVVARYGEAREILGQRYIVGADAGRSRHDAMELGEAGAEYVGFGIPAHVEDRDAARGRRLYLVEWWSELVEVPCVAFDVETPEEASALARARADFIAMRAPSAASPDELRRWAHDIVQALSPAEDMA
jgi:thiamine-phosphate pyrophosphorylase